MPTAEVRNKELAIALKFSVFISDVVIVVIAVEGQIETSKSESAAFLGITLGLLPLANHSRIHRSFSFQDEVPGAAASLSRRAPRSGTASITSAGSLVRHKKKARGKDAYLVTD